jgi:high-affinity nickel permease
MAWLDDQIAQLGHGAPLFLALAVAVLLGLRHATDPDHLTAVATIVASDDEGGRRRAGRLGLAWGAGHATTLLLFGAPVVLFKTVLPGGIERAAEVAVGIAIAALALRLLLRWRRGRFYGRGGEHAHVQIGRSPLAAYGVGLVHGLGGSAAVGLLLIGAVSTGVQAVVALALFAGAAAVSMSVVSATVACALVQGPLATRLERVVPLLGLASLLFGCWYALGALQAVPYGL